MILTVEWYGEVDANLGIDLKIIPVVACSSVDHYPSLYLLCLCTTCTCNVIWCGALYTLIGCFFLAVG